MVAGEQLDEEEPVEELDASAIDDLLARISRPGIPLTEPWGLSIGDLLRTRWELPGPVERLVRVLNRAGAIRLSPTGVGLDHVDVAWEDLEEVRMVSLFVLAQGGMLETVVDRLTRFLPPVPGRRWLLRRVVRLVAGLVARFSTLEPEDWPEVPGALVHRGRFGRTRETEGGLIAALLWAAVPEAGSALEQAAVAHGARIRPVAG